MKNRLALRIPNIFSFDQQIRWGLKPLLIVLAWMDKAWWPPYRSQAEWDDHAYGVRRQRRGIFIGRLYVGIEGVPVASRVIRVAS